MPTTKIHWGQIIVVFTIVLLSLWAATQWTAWRLGFQSALGSPWFEAPGRFPVYSPLIFFWWWYAFDAYAPDIFLEGGAIAASGGFLVIIAAIAISVWRAREEREAETYGSARWATTKEIKSAELISGRGVVLGKFVGRARHGDGNPRHEKLRGSSSLALARPCEPCARCAFERLPHRRTRHAKPPRYLVRRQRREI